MFCGQSYQLEVLFAQFFWLLLFLFLPPCNYSTLRDRTLELPILPGEGVFFLFLFFFRIGFCLGIIKHQAAFLSSSQVFAQYLCGVWGRGFKKVFSFFWTSTGISLDLVWGVGGPPVQPLLAGPLWVPGGGMARMNRPAPVEVSYRNMRFLITHNPSNATLSTFIEVSGLPGLGGCPGWLPV